MHADDCDTSASVQRTVQRTLNFPAFEYVPTRESDVDRAAACAGPGFAIVADADGVRGVVRYDVEAGCPIDVIPAAGFVS